ncbi:hypothetical protein K445DRAFT_10085 [Daldinia sp. EC12]|nr:hypothetical protein K445DRAFT_10085 [Daldinia sp. EC12]
MSKIGLLLSPATQKICHEWLAEHPLGDLRGDGELPHLGTYKALKQYLEHYEEEGMEPKLSCNELPRGGIKWYRQQLKALRNYESDIESAKRSVERDGDFYGAWLGTQENLED